MNPAAEGAAAQKSRHKEDKNEKKKKRKDATEHHGADPSAAEEESVHKKKKKKKQKMDNDEGKAEPKQKPTVSIAVAGSIIDNAQSLELAPPSWPVRLPARQPSSASTRSLSSTAIPRRRTAVVPKVKRRVVRGFLSGYWSIWKRHSTCAAASSRCIRTLSLWGCFRRSMHHTICASTSGVNFVKTGVTLDGDRSKGTLVDVGLSKNVLVEQILERGKRVTIAMGTNRDITTACVRKVVSPSTPSEEMGSYWGYKVRYASNLSGVLNDSPYKEGYDHIIGTSEHGEIISSSELILPSFRHLLIAFGGLAGLEESIEEDINLKGKGANDVFTSYLNTCPNQGSRTIRTEEALLISLQYFQDPIRRAK